MGRSRLCTSYASNDVPPFLWSNFFRLFFMSAIRAPASQLSHQVCEQRYSMLCYSLEGTGRHFMCSPYFGKRSMMWGPIKRRESVPDQPRPVMRSRLIWVPEHYLNTHYPSTPIGPCRCTDSNCRQSGMVQGRRALFWPPRRSGVILPVPMGACHACKKKSFSNALLSHRPTSHFSAVADRAL